MRLIYHTDDSANEKHPNYDCNCNVDNLEGDELQDDDMVVMPINPTRLTLDDIFLFGPNVEAFYAKQQLRRYSNIPPTANSTNSLSPAVLNNSILRQHISDDEHNNYERQEDWAIIPYFNQQQKPPQPKSSFLTSSPKILRKSLAAFHVDYTTDEEEDISINSHTLSCSNHSKILADNLFLRKSDNALDLSADQHVISDVPTSIPDYDDTPSYINKELYHVIETRDLENAIPSFAELPFLNKQNSRVLSNTAEADHYHHTENPYPFLKRNFRLDINTITKSEDDTSFDNEDHKNRAKIWKCTLNDAPLPNPRCTRKFTTLNIEITPNGIRDAAIVNHNLRDIDLISPNTTESTSTFGGCDQRYSTDSGLSSTLSNGEEERPTTEHLEFPPGVNLSNEEGHYKVEVLSEARCRPVYYPTTQQIEKNVTSSRNINNIQIPTTIPTVNDDIVKEGSCLEPSSSEQIAYACVQAFGQNPFLALARATAHAATISTAKAAFQTSLGTSNQSNSLVINKEPSLNEICPSLTPSIINNNPKREPCYYTVQVSASCIVRNTNTLVGNISSIGEFREGVREEEEFISQAHRIQDTLRKTKGTDPLHRNDLNELVCKPLNRLLLLDGSTEFEAEIKRMKEAETSYALVASAAVNSSSSGFLPNIMNGNIARTQKDTGESIDLKPADDKMIELVRSGDKYPKSILVNVPRASLGDYDAHHVGSIDSNFPAAATSIATSFKYHKQTGTESNSDTLRRPKINEPPVVKGKVQDKTVGTKIKKLTLSTKVIEHEVPYEDRAGHWLPGPEEGYSSEDNEEGNEIYCISKNNCNRATANSNDLAGRPPHLFTKGLNNNRSLWSSSSISTSSIKPVPGFGTRKIGENQRKFLPTTQLPGTLGPRPKLDEIEVQRYRNRLTRTQIKIITSSPNVTPAIPISLSSDISNKMEDLTTSKEWQLPVLDAEDATNAVDFKGTAEFKDSSPVVLNNNTGVMVVTQETPNVQEKADLQSKVSFDKTPLLLSSIVKSNKPKETPIVYTSFMNPRFVFSNNTKCKKSSYLESKTATVTPNMQKCTLPSISKPKNSKLFKGTNRKEILDSSTTICKGQFKSKISPPSTSSNYPTREEIFETTENQSNDTSSYQTLPPSRMSSNNNLNESVSKPLEKHVNIETVITKKPPLPKTMIPKPKVAITRGQRIAKRRSSADLEDVEKYELNESLKAIQDSTVYVKELLKSRNMTTSLQYCRNNSGDKKNCSQVLFAQNSAPIETAEKDDKVSPSPINLSPSKTLIERLRHRYVDKSGREVGKSSSDFAGGIPIIGGDKLLDARLRGQIDKRYLKSVPALSLKTKLTNHPVLNNLLSRSLCDVQDLGRNDKNNLCTKLSSPTQTRLPERSSELRRPYEIFDLILRESVAKLAKKPILSQDAANRYRESTDLLASKRKSYSVGNVLLIDYDGINAVDPKTRGANHAKTKECSNFEHSILPTKRLVAETNIDEIYYDIATETDFMLKCRSLADLRNDEQIFTGTNLSGQASRRSMALEKDKVNTEQSIRSTGFSLSKVPLSSQQATNKASYSELNDQIQQATSLLNIPRWLSSVSVNTVVSQSRDDSILNESVLTGSEQGGDNSSTFHRVENNPLCGYRSGDYRKFRLGDERGEDNSFFLRHGDQTYMSLNTSATSHYSYWDASGGSSSAPSRTSSFRYPCISYGNSIVPPPNVVTTKTSEVTRYDNNNLPSYEVAEIGLGVHDGSSLSSYSNDGSTSRQVFSKLKVNEEIEDTSVASNNHFRRSLKARNSFPRYFTPIEGSTGGLGEIANGNCENNHNVDNSFKTELNPTAINYEPETYGIKSVCVNDPVSEQNSIMECQIPTKYEGPIVLMIPPPPSPSEPSLHDELVHSNNLCNEEAVIYATDHSVDDEVIKYKPLEPYDYVREHNLLPQRYAQSGNDTKERHMVPTKKIRTQTVVNLRSRYEGSLISGQMGCCYNNDNNLEGMPNGATVEVAKMCPQMSLKTTAYKSIWNKAKLFGRPVPSSENETQREVRHYDDKPVVTTSNNSVLGNYWFNLQPPKRSLLRTKKSEIPVDGKSQNRDANHQNKSSLHFCVSNAIPDVMCFDEHHTILPNSEVSKSNGHVKNTANSRYPQTRYVNLANGDINIQNAQGNGSIIIPFSMKQTTLNTSCEKSLLNDATYYEDNGRSSKTSSGCVLDESVTTNDQASSLVLLNSSYNISSTIPVQLHPPQPLKAIPPPTYQLNGQQHTDEECIGNEYNEDFGMTHLPEEYVKLTKAPIRHETAV